MKAIACDVRRALTGRWFWAALLATTAALYLSIGQAADALMEDAENFRFTLSDLLLMALRGDFGMLTLPALSALPFAAQALHEIKCGAVRPAVFRAGRRMWILGKAAGCILSGMVLQAAAAGLLGVGPYIVDGYVSHTGREEIGLLVFFHGGRLLFSPIVRREACRKRAKTVGK